MADELLGAGPGDRRRTSTGSPTAGPEVVASYQKRLTERVQALVQGQGVTVEPKDLIREVAIFAERADIAEEIVRLRAHLAQYVEVIDEPESAGRKLEFVVQEMGRETNTIGSKANDVEISRARRRDQGAPGEDPRADPERRMNRPVRREESRTMWVERLGRPAGPARGRVSGPSGCGQEHAHPPASLEAPALERPALGLGDDPRPPRPGEIDGRRLPLPDPRGVRVEPRPRRVPRMGRVHGHFYGTPAEPGLRGRWPRGESRHPGDRRPGGAAGPRARSRRRSSSSSRRRASATSKAGSGAAGPTTRRPIHRRLAQRPARARPRPTGTTIRSINDDLDRCRRRLRRAPDADTVVEVDPSMLEELKEEKIVNKVGGRFKLSTLIQKRMIALNQGARPLVDIRGARQDDDRDPGDHAGQDLPRPVGQPPDERADRGGRGRDGRSYPAVRIDAGRHAPAARSGREDRESSPAVAADH